MLALGYTSCIPGDIGKTVTGVGSGAEGILVAYDNGTRVWTINTNEVFAPADVCTLSGGGTGAGTITSIATALQPVGGTDWSIQYIFYFTGGPIVLIQYGQATFASSTDALAALQDPIELDPIVNVGTFRGWLVVKNGAIALNDPAEAIFVDAGKFGLASVMSGGAGGESNTASNIGTSGVGFFGQKSGVDLQFKNLNSLTSAITVTNNPAPDWTVDLDLIPANISDFDARIDNVFNTGLLKGGEITINLGDNTKFDIAAGQGYVVDNYTDPAAPTRTHVTWLAQVGLTPSYLTTEQWTYVGFDSAGALQQQSTPFTISQRRDIICIGKLVHNNYTTIAVAIQNCNVEFDTNLQFIGMTYVFQSMNLSGNVYSPNAANLRLKKSAGQTWRVGVNYKTSYKQPNISTDIVVAPITDLRRDYQDGAGGWVEDPTNYLGIDPDNYDSGLGYRVTMDAVGYTPCVPGDIGKFVTGSVSLATGKLVAYDNGTRVWTINTYSTFQVGDNCTISGAGTGIGDITGIATGFQPVPADKFTIQLLYHFGGPGNRTWVQYGQAYYDHMADALRALSEEIQINSYFNEACFRCWLVVQQGCADLTDTTKAAFVTAGTLGLLDQKAGVTDIDTAVDTSTDTTDFKGVLSASDTDVQKALNTLDANNYRRSFLLMGG